MRALVSLLALVGLCLATPAEAQRFPGRALGFPRGFSFVSAAASYIGPVANNTVLPTSTRGGQQEQSTIHTVHAPGGITNIQLVSSGNIISGSYLSETPTGADYTEQVSVRPVGGSTWTPITTGGNSVWTVSNGTVSYSDLVPFVIADGSSFELWEREVGTAMPALTNGGFEPMLATDEGYNSSTSTTTPKTVTSTNPAVRAATIVGLLGTRTGDSVAIIGDSQVAYISSSYTANDAVPANHNRGDIAQTIGGTYAYLNLGVSGDQYSTWLFSNHAMTLALARTATIIITEKGVNEFVNKGASTAAIAAAWTARALPLFNGKKVIAASLTPYVTLINSTAVFTGSYSAGTLTVTAMTSGTIYPGEKLSTGGPSFPVITGQLSGTTGGIGTYSLSQTTTQASASITATGANIASDGSDQTVTSSSPLIPTFNSSLTFGGVLSAPLDRFTPLQSPNAANKWTGDGANAYTYTKDGLHVAPYAAYTIIPQSAPTWLSQLASLAVANYTAPPVTFATTSPAWSGGYLTTGTVSRNDVFPGNNVFTLVMRIKVAPTQTAVFNFIPSTVLPNIKFAQINASGQIAIAYSNSGTAYATSSAINDGADHEFAVTDDGTTQTAYLDGVSFGSSTYTHQTSGQRLMSLAASSVATTSVAIREVTLWSTVKFTGTYTPVLFAGTESGLLALWHLSADPSGTIGPALPQ